MSLKIFQKPNYALMRMMVRVMPSCRDVSELVSQSMDQRLPLTKRMTIRLHVSMCSLCRRYEKQLRLLREGARHFADPEENTAQSSLSPEAAERLKKALEDHK